MEFISNMPTYKDLEKKIKDLEQIILEHTQANKRQQFQRNFAIELTKTKTLTEALNKILTNIFRLHEFDSGCIYLINKKTNGLNLIVHQGLPQVFVDKVKYYDADDIRLQMIMKGDPIYQKASELPAPIKKDLEMDGIHTLAVIPIKHGGDIIGAINLASHTHDVITDNTRSLLEAVAKVEIGVAISRVYAEEELRESEEKFLKAFHCGNTISGISDIETGEFIEVNRAFYNSLGFTPEEVIGKKSSEVLHLDLKFRNRTIAAMKRQGFIKNEKAVIYTKSGTPRNMLFSAEIIEIAGKKYNYTNAIDITEHKQLEEQLRQSQKLESISTLAGGIAHDFNNMLSVITGNLSYALSKLRKTDELFDVLFDVQEGAKQAQKLTHQLLTFSKGGEPVKKAANINRVLEESATFVTRGARSKCEFVFDNDLWIAEVDTGQLHQAISNLVINADQAMPEGGTIQIHTKNELINNINSLDLQPGQYLKITLKDQGVGIPEKFISRIFDPFFTTKQKGSGLGLATTYSVIKRHGGQISVESKVGNGTTFEIYLPAAEKSSVHSYDKKSSKHQGKGRILIMDDQELILKMVGNMLNIMGYDTVLATSGVKAVEIYREAYQSKNPFDMVILDLTVPGGMGGAKTIPELLKIDPKVKAVVSSGYSNDPIMANYQDYGFCGVVPKPYSMDQLSEVLNKIFDEND